MLKNQLSPHFFLLLLFSAPLFSQNSLEGNLKDQNDEPVAYANVILLNAEDSTSVYKGTVSSEEGQFLFEDIAADTYVLKVSFVGFEDHLKRIEVSGNEQIGEIVLQEATAGLGEVAITVKNPTITRKVDRLVFNVENSSLSSGSTWEILEKTPMVIAIDDNLQVRNQGVEVYINDRKVHLSASELKTLLDNYSAENIKSIEVITNPPARYEAEGGSILNIVTTKSISPGYKGSLNAALTQAIFPKYNFGTSHYFKSDDLNIFANYSFSPRKEFKEDDSYINFMQNGRVNERWNTDFERTTRSNGHSANIILDYNFDERNTLSFSSNGTFSPGETSDINGLTQINRYQSVPDSRLLTESGLEDDQSNLGMDLEFKHQLKREGAQISAKAHYTHYEHDRFQDISSTLTDDGGVNLQQTSFSSDASQEIDILTGQLDYSTPWGTTSFEVGAKASVINSESSVEYTSEDPLPGQAPLDNFLYDENIYAAYTSISKDWETWSIKAGLRGEYTSREGDSRSMDQVDNRDYFEAFPTFYLMHAPNANHSFSFDFSRRIQRPRYESLNPFRYYLNEFSYNSGNPNLRAAISSNFNVNYTYKGAYFFDLYYRDNGPNPGVFSFQDNENRTLRNISVNVLESTSYGLDFSHGRSLTSFWYAYAYMSVFHDEETFLAVESGNREVTNEANGFFGSFGNSFTLSKDGTFSGDLNFTYVSDWISGSYNLDPMATLSMGVRKTFWNNRAELSLHLEDILDETNTRMTSRYLNQDNSFLAMPESRYVRVGFKYNFGNFRLRDNQRAIEAAERDRL